MIPAAANEAFALHGIDVVCREHFWSRPKWLLRDFCLRLPHGQMCALLGANGAGKTTALRVLLGLSQSQRGDGHLMGHALGEPAGRAQIGFSPEQPALPLALTPLEYVAIVAGLRGARGAQRREWAAHALQRLGMTPVQTHRMRSFSKGMRQRVGLAQAIVGAPALLVFDEPLSGLDPPARHRVRQLLLAERARGAAILLATHSLAEVIADCDRAAVLSAGTLTHEGTPAALMAQAQTLPGAPVAPVRVQLGQFGLAQQKRLAPQATVLHATANEVALALSSVEQANALVAGALCEGAFLIDFTWEARMLERLLLPASPTPC